MHIGADLTTDPRHARWPAPRGCHDTVARMTRLCAAVGIREQQRLCGREATRAGVGAALTRAAGVLDGRGLLVVTFSGHSERGEHDLADTAWCLYDGAFGFGELAGALAAAPATARVVVVADTCYAAALARHTSWPCTLVLLAACDDYQVTLARPVSDFVVRLERLVCPGGVRDPRCVSYAWLRRELRRDTPDAERPQVWTSHAEAWTHRPFDPLPP